MPEQLRNKLLLIGQVSERQTRQAEHVRVQFRKTKSAQKSLFYEGIKMYNAIPVELKHCDSLAIF